MSIPFLKSFGTVELFEYYVTKQSYVFQVTAYYKKSLHWSRKRRHLYVVNILCPQTLPNIFFDSHFKDSYVYATEFATIDQNQRVELEGEFNSSFQLYAPKHLEEESLKLITPDVMLLLLEEFNQADVSMSDQVITLRSNTAFSQQQVERFTDLLLTKVARFHRNTPKDQMNEYAKNRLVRDEQNEAIKLGTRLINSKSVLVLVILNMYAVIGSIFYLIIDIDDKSLQDLLVVVGVGYLMGVVSLLLLYINDNHIKFIR